jgi:hypothetical protein
MKNIRKKFIHKIVAASVPAWFGIFPSIYLSIVNKFIDMPCGIIVSLLFSDLICSSATSGRQAVCKKRMFFCPFVIKLLAATTNHGLD